MSVVLHGLGLGDVDTGSTIVAFGLARDLEQGENPLQAVMSAGIENMFVIDYGAPYSRPLTDAEYRRFMRLVQMLLMGDVQFTDEKVNGKPGLRIFRKPIVRKVA